MDKAFIQKGVNQYVRVSLPRDEDIEFNAGLIRDQDRRGSPIYCFQNTVKTLMSFTLEKMGVLTGAR